jgi:hypothetical protein
VIYSIVAVQYIHIAVQYIYSIHTVQNIYMCCIAKACVCGFSGSTRSCSMLVAAAADTARTRTLAACRLSVYATVCTLTVMLCSTML